MAIVVKNELAFSFHFFYSLHFSIAPIISIRLIGDKCKANKDESRLRVAVLTSRYNFYLFNFHDRTKRFGPWFLTDKTEKS